MLQSRRRKDRMPARAKPTADIVLPLYNEAEAFEQTYRGLRAVIDRLP